MTSAVSTTAFSGVRINSFEVSTKFGCGTVPSSSWVGNVPGYCNETCASFGCYSKTNLITFSLVCVLSSICLISKR